MDNHELAEINTSLQALVRRAYDLGRSEALKKVVDVLSADRPAAEQLALIGPSEKTSQPTHEDRQEQAINGKAQPTAKPWWAWPVR